MLAVPLSWFMPRVGVGRPAAGDPQHGPGGAIHQSGLPGPAAGRPGALEHGRPGAGVRQHFCRTTLAHGQIRGGLYQRLSGRDGSPSGVGSVFELLQPRTHSSSVGLSHARKCAFRALRRPEVRGELDRRGASGEP